MKKIILPLIALSLLTACGDSGDKKATDTKETTTTTTTEKDITQDPNYQKGISLIGKSDCLTCHKIDEPFTGPSYRDVANKYASLPDTVVPYLAGKIITGGNGVWGPAMMTPHPQVSKEDAEAMVRYILLLKK
ncbi:MAG TPA: c-type cytochrome [Chitinophagaceae bacterium]